jgi:hypothetical protein
MWLPALCGHRVRKQASAVPALWQPDRMRNSCSVYVDVGYLLAAAATRVTVRPSVAAWSSPIQT